jgi:hypothetical protein
MIQLVSALTPVRGLYMCAPEFDLHLTVNTASAPSSGVPFVSVMSLIRSASLNDRLGPALPTQATNMRHSTSPQLNWLMAHLRPVALGNRVLRRLQANPQEISPRQWMRFPAHRWGYCMGLMQLLTKEYMIPRENNTTDAFRRLGPVLGNTYPNLMLCC